MNITNDKNVIVFKNDYGKYSVKISKKNMEGEYENAYIPIQFNKDIELENRTTIRIKTAWLSFYKINNEEGRQETKFFIRCSDFDKIDTSQEEKLSIKTESKVGQEIKIEDKDLPF